VKTNDESVIQCSALNTSSSTFQVKQNKISQLIFQFENNVSANLKKYLPGTVFLAAVSGGADSIAMITVLCTLRNTGIIGTDALYCLHVEHGLRPAQESCGDAEFVHDFCQTNNIECRIVHIPPGKISVFAKRKGIGIEAAARFFRHKALYNEAKCIESQNQKSSNFPEKKVIILLAHTKDDLLETALMRILRGSGPAGLALIPAKRGRIVRPLLSMIRSDVIEYLKEKNISWREDSTNTELMFLRNRIRQQLIPLLNESFPSWKKGVFSMAQTQSLVKDFINDETGQRIHWKIFLRTSRRDAGDCTKTSRGDAEAQSGSLKSSFFYSGSQNSAINNARDSVFTDSENFFFQPIVVREEAIFQGIGLLMNIRNISHKNTSNLRFGVQKRRGNKRKKERSFKRSVIRKFCEGKINTADLGYVQLRQENGKVLLSRNQKEFFECGVSRLING